MAAAGRNVVLVLVLMAGTGCQDEPIHVQRVKKQPATTERTIVAVVPRGVSTLFIKLSGPSTGVAEDEAAFRQFLETVTISQPDRPPQWQAPADWREEKTMRDELAVWRTAAGVRVSLSELQGEAASNLLDNVIRWRRQLGMSRIAEADLPKMSKPTTVAGIASTLVDIENTELPPTRLKPAPRSQVDTEKKPRPVGPAPPTFQAPAAWTRLPPTSMRVASFRIGTMDRGAEVSIIPLPMPAGSVADNVNRWRGEIGLPPQKQSEVDAGLKDIEVAGKKCAYCDLLGPEGPKQERTLAVMAQRGELAWFIKLRGRSDVVAGQQAAFENFVRSIAFPAGDKYD